MLQRTQAITLKLKRNSADPRYQERIKDVASPETKRKSPTNPRKKAAEAKVVEMPATPNSAEVSLDDPSLYINRELSLLEFQRRVLDEARDDRNKLLERVKFLSI